MEAPKLELSSQTQKKQDTEKKSNKTNKWSKKRCAHLLHLVEQHGENWPKISEEIKLFTP